MTDLSAIRNNLLNIITINIVNELTIGRRDNGLNSYTDDEIKKFINENINLINNTIDDMIRDYGNDNELHLLENIHVSEYDRVYEYLENYIIFSSS